MILAVTGATGFLGRHFVAKARSRGFEVRALAGAGDPAGERLEREGVPVVRGRLAETVAAAKLLEGAEVLVHLAALGVQSRDRDWAHTVQVNAVEPLSWVELAARMRVRCVVAAGTCLEYRGRGTLPEAPCPEAERVPLDEESSLEARDAYGATKAAGGLLLRALARERGLPTWYLRFASLYGPGDDVAKLLPAAIAAARARAPLEMSGGEQIREWLHVDDAAEGLLAVLGREPQGGVAVMNVGTGQGIATRDLVRCAFEAGGAGADLMRIGARPYRPDEAHYLVMEVGRAVETLGFSPKIGLERGLRALIANNGD